MDCDLSSISNVEVALVDIIRCNSLAVLADGDNSLAFPREQLLAMNLRSMLMAIRTLGRHRLMADGNTGVKDEFQIVSAAASVLSQWPNNFIALLKDIGKGIEANGEGGVRKQFSSIYQGLFKNRAINPREQVDFMRVAFLEFAERDWDRGVLDHKLLKQVRGRVEKRFITQSELAANVGISPVTASRWIRDQRLPSRRVRCGKSTRILVDSSQSTIPRTTAGKTYWEREAARRLGLSVGVLRFLRNSGIFEFNHLLPTKGGYHELDMDAFNEKLMALAPPLALIGDHSKEYISLKTALNGRHDSPATKGEIVRALFAGELVIARNMDETTAGLLINRAECRSLVISVRNRVTGDTIITDDACR
jgi:Helix-turn-helix